MNHYTQLGFIDFIKASAYASENGILTSEMIDRNTNDAVEQHKHKMDWLEKDQLAARHQQV